MAQTVQAGIAKCDAAITKLESGIQQIEAGLEAAGATKLETGFQAKAGMTFQQFCQQVLGQLAVAAASALEDPFSSSRV